MKKTVAVIGGGPSGMMAAGTAAANGHAVTLFEKNDRLGRKMLITGKGRCNLTNASPVSTLIENVPGNPSFLYSAFHSFDSEATMSFFEGLGLKLKVERGNRVFPVSDSAADAVGAMRRFLKRGHVDIRLNEETAGILIEDRCVKGVVGADGKRFGADAVIVATGGLSYPLTGSTGDGYRFAREAGHTVTTLSPALTPLLTEEPFVLELQGLSLKNVGVTVTVDGKSVYKAFGEMMFTHFGVSGPVVLSAGRALLGKFHRRPVLSVDLKPALSEKELDNRILRDFNQYSNKDFANSLDDLLPQKMIGVVVARSGVAPRKKVRDVTKAERRALVALLKDFTVTIRGARGFDEAVVTSGGVSVGEIEPGTMRSKLVGGLCFTGEVLDVDGLTGGFNLQIAFSTGFLAGSGI